MPSTKSAAKQTNSAEGYINISAQIDELNNRLAKIERDQLANAQNLDTSKGVFEFEAAELPPYEPTGVLLADHEIKQYLEAGMISPFEDKLIREVDGVKVCSYGLGSAGYDIRLSEQVKMRSLTNLSETDPKFPQPSQWVDLQARAHSSGQGKYVVIPPNTFILGASVETFQMPEDVVGIAYGKSTLARNGLVVTITPLEPGWNGTLVIEVANVGPAPAHLYVNEGVAQLQFYRIAKPDVGYGDRPSKYQGQTGVKLGEV